MDLLIEICLELLFEGTVELSGNKKVPKWIRYPLLVLVLLFVSAVIIGIMVLGVFIATTDLLIGLGIIAIGLVFLGGLIYKIMKVHKEMKK